MHKWRNPQPKLQPDDLVIIKEDGPFASTWPLARIVKTYPGNKGKVRIAQLKMTTTFLKHLIAKLALIFPNEDMTLAESGKDHLAFGWGRMFGRLHLKKKRKENLYLPEELKEKEHLLLRIISGTI